jgi:nucleoside phosphorylase/CheY-like chemotaxis protein
MNVSVLVVDDDADKRGQICAVARDTLGADGVALTEVADVVGAWREMGKRRFDLMILDLNIPKRGGADPERDGGLALLKRIRQSKDVHVPVHILGLTAYEELRAQFVEGFAIDGWGIVRYEAHSDQWADTLARKLLHIAETHVAANFGFKIDLGIVVALERPELEAVLALPASWVTIATDGDDAIYHRGVFTRQAAQVSVVATAAVDMGMTCAAIASMKLIEAFRPKVLAMVGIAAGSVGHMGDVLIADQTWDYGSGKATVDANGVSTIQPAPVAVLTDAHLRNKLSYFVRRGGCLEQIGQRWNGKAMPWPLGAHIGPIASGAAVLADATMVEKIKTHNRKVIGIEMEAYAVYQAARLCAAPRPSAVAIKGVSDTGGKDKSDEYQKYAAFASANFLYEFALELLVPDAFKNSAGPRSA